MSKKPESNQKKFLLISSEPEMSDIIGKNLASKGAIYEKFPTLELALEYMEDNLPTHIMIDITFTAFEKAKFSKKIKESTVICPKVKSISFKDISSRLGNESDKFVIGSKQDKEDSFVQEVNSFVMGDKRDISQDFSQLYNNRIKTFANVNQVAIDVEFLEMTSKGIVVFSKEEINQGDKVQIKIENFLNKADSTIEISTECTFSEKEQIEDEVNYYVEVQLDEVMQAKWNELYEEYAEKQLEINEFLEKQKH